MNWTDLGLNVAEIVANNLITLKPHRALAEITADAVLEERHLDELAITEHPVERGTSIADHAYKVPAEVMLTYGWSGGGYLESSHINDLYQQLLTLMDERILFTVYTGRRAYQNMILKNLSLTTNPETENALIIEATCREVLLAETQTVKVNSASVQKEPHITNGTTKRGEVPLKPTVLYPDPPFIN